MATVRLVKAAQDGPVSPVKLQPITGTDSSAGVANAGQVVVLNPLGQVNPDMLPVPEFEHSFSWGDASPHTVYTDLDGKTIREIVLTIDVPFNGTNASLRVSDSSRTLMSTIQNSPYEASSYVVYPMQAYTVDDVVSLTITPGAGASQGSGRVLLVF